MKRMLLTAIGLFVSCVPASAQIHRVAQMNADQIRALDKQKTVVILTGGILEEHGPHLPSFTDGYANEWATQRLAEAIAARPGWAVLVFPTIPIGSGGANEIGAKYVFPGSYCVRRTTLRAIYMDLATELGEQGFRWIFIVDGHGSPFHNLMLDQACEYFRDSYGGRMVHLMGLQPTEEQRARLKMPTPAVAKSERENKENGLMDVHSGMDETSLLLFLRPDLVNPIYRTLKPYPANNPPELIEAAKGEDWPGYLGSPRLANSSHGAKIIEFAAARCIVLATAILDGLDEREIPRYANSMLGDKTIANELEGSSRYEAEVERKQRDWLKKKGLQ